MIHELYKIIIGVPKKASGSDLIVVHAEHDELIVNGAHSWDKYINHELLSAMEKQAPCKFLYYGSRHIDYLELATCLDVAKYYEL